LSSGVFGVFGVAGTSSSASGAGVAFFLVQLKFLTHRIAFCSAFSGGSDGSTRAIASSTRKKLVLKIKQDENKNE